jgi:hypothetical protein
MAVLSCLQKIHPEISGKIFGVDQASLNPSMRIPQNGYRFYSAVRALGLGYSRSGVCGQPLPIKFDNSSQQKQQRLAHPQLGLPSVSVLQDLRLAMVADGA